MQSIQMAEFDREALRTRLQKMSDKQLRKFGETAKYMVSPIANMGKPPLPTFVLQLAEARAEWRRRHFLKKATARVLGVRIYLGAWEG